MACDHVIDANITAYLHAYKIPHPVQPVKIVWDGCIPELVESLLVSLKHMPHVEVQCVGCVPVLQLLEVGVLCESHDVWRGLLCSTVFN